MYILGINFLSRTTEELSPYFRLYHSLSTTPRRCDYVVCPSGLFVTSNERLSLSTTKTDTLTILKYENVYLLPSLALTEPFGTRNEMATIFHNAIQKITHISPQYPIFGCFSQLPSFQKDIGPCVTTGVSVLIFYTT